MQQNFETIDTVKKILLICYVLVVYFFRKHHYAVKKRFYMISKKRPREHPEPQLQLTDRSTRACNVWQLFPKKATVPQQLNENIKQPLRPSFWFFMVYLDIEWVHLM